ncbi:MAG TPA: response regulator [Candidatus Aquilonibacter sp.]|nr:response regulator [Candidatus Aquilonibacter sp.]
MPQKKILIVDDDDDVRNLHSLRLGDSYETVMTGDPEEALALALEHKPAAILLDLMMPKLSGFELCQTLHSLSYTSLIPIFMITGESSAKYKDHCESLGAKAYFEKPVNYAALKAALAAELESQRAERRAHVRLNMRVVVKLRGKDATGKDVEISTVTENASPAGFLAACPLTLKQGGIFDVFVVASGERFAGRAKPVRIESRGAPWQRYGFQFTEVTNDWILRAT